MQCLAASRGLPAGPASRVPCRRLPPRPASKARLQPVRASCRPVNPLEVRVVRHLKTVAAWGGANTQGRFSIQQLQRLLGRQDAAQASQLAGLPSLYSPPRNEQPGPAAQDGMAALDSLLSKWYPRARPSLTNAADSAVAAAGVSHGLCGLPTGAVRLDVVTAGDQPLPNFPWRHGDLLGDPSLGPTVIYNVVLSNGHGLFAGVGVADLGMFAYREEVRSAGFEADGRAHRLAAELWANPLVVAAVPLVRTVYRGNERVLAASRYQSIFPDLVQHISSASL